jgi:hypothetical protein
MLISQFDWNGFRINCLKQVNFDIKSEVSQKNVKTSKGSFPGPPLSNPAKIVQYRSCPSKKLSTAHYSSQN